MRKLLITLAALSLGFGLRAEEAASSYSITTDFSFASEYIFRGVKQQNNALQPSVSFEAGSLSGGVWTSQAVDQRSASWAQGNEIDVYGSYGFSLSENYSLSLGATAYLYPAARPSLGELDSTFELSLGVSGPVGPLSGAATYFHDFDLDADIAEFGLGYSVDINPKSAFEIGATYGFARFDAGGDYDYYAVNASVSYKLTEAATLSFGLHWADTDIRGLKSNSWFSIGVSTGL